MDKTLIFKTSDIVLAATLKEKSYDLIDIEKHNNKGIFVFQNVDNNFISDFDLGRSRIEPIAFNNAIKQLTTSVRRILN